MLAMLVCGDKFTAEEKHRNFDYYEEHHRPRLLAVRLHPGGDRRRGGAPRARLRLLRRGRADGPRGPRAQHPRRGSHRLAGGRLDRRRLRASRGCATTDGRSPSPRGCRRRSPAGVQAQLRRLLDASRGEARPGHLRGPPRPSAEIAHHGEELTVEQGAPQTLPIPPCSRPASRPSSLPDGRRSGASPSRPSCARPPYGSACPSASSRRGTRRPSRPGRRPARRTRSGRARGSSRSRPRG